MKTRMQQQQQLVLLLPTTISFCINSNPSQLLLLVLSLLLSSSFLSPPLVSAEFNLTLHPYHPFPDSIAHELNRRVNASLSRRLILAQERDQQFPLTTTSTATTAALAPPTTSCYTGNPIDDCWRCDPNWPNNRQHLADCAIGFGQQALGGKGGPYYIVSDPSDTSPTNPKPGTLRHAASLPGPIWILFSSDMTITVTKPIIINSHKTLDGRGVRVTVTGTGCLAVQYVSNVIIHNIQIFGCLAGDESDGDGIHVFNAVNVWIDHCTLSNCADGLIDCTHRSTAITLSNNHFFNHDKVILLGHSDEFPDDRGMQVTVAFNRFGDGVVERLPRCRFGYFHVVNNDYRGWGIYAVGGSMNPTINSQGNRYYAPPNPNLKEVTKRIANDEGEWERWNWRTEGDMMVNGAFFVPSGDGLTNQYAYAMSLDPRSADAIDYITLNSGILLPNGGGDTVLGLGAPAYTAASNGGTTTAPATGGSGSTTTSGSNAGGLVITGASGDGTDAGNAYGYGAGMMPNSGSTVRLAPLAYPHQKSTMIFVLISVVILN